MEFKLENEIDKGPIVKWIANKTLNISHWISEKAYPYADMYTAVWDDYEDDVLATPQNQMGLFDETLPQFQHLTDDLI